MGYLDRVDLEEMRKQVAKSSKPPRRLLRDRMRKPLERLRQTRILPDITSSLCLPIQVGQTAANIAWTTPTAQWVLRQIQMKKPKMTMQA
ncbi:hypothetical protein PF007_g31839, partial [Phytophthora fragariae]